MDCSKGASRTRMTFLVLVLVPTLFSVTQHMDFRTIQQRFRPCLNSLMIFMRPRLA